MTLARDRAAGATPGERFWRRSLYDYAAMTAEAPGGREGGPQEPERFRRFGALPRFPLPAPPAALAPSEQVPSAAFHSALLHYTNGVLRTEFGPTARWPYHRATPSARCFAPVDITLWTPGHDGLPAGIYAHDPAHHALVRLRSGDFDEVVGAALGAHLDGAVGVLFLSTVFWRTAFRYGDYAYRLCAQETGLVAGNALLVAEALGVRGQVHHQFLDGVLERLIGVRPPQESVALALPLYARGGSSRRRSAPVAEAELAVPAPVERPAPSPGHGLELCPDLVELDRSARLADTAAFGELPAREGAGAVPSAPPVDLAAVLRDRTSGSLVFRVAGPPVPAETVRRITDRLPYAYVSDARPHGTPSPVRAHLWTSRVDGMRAGVHELTPDGPVHLGDLPLERLGVAAPNIDYRSVPAVLFLSGPREAAQLAFGDRGFRVLHHEAGVLAQRACVLGAAEGLAARIHNGYDAAVLSRALALPEGHEPLFQIALGAPGPDERCLLPVPGQTLAGSPHPEGAHQ
ncbi:hypothetical protein CP970_30935 [Streptomyces kanamyceticus]|uniref:Uncharacterized protein n=2 Tax=Streptomyces kanamyceticus TaxID=1967 RepID=A0A5J6GI34_STRKN|nr:hypothetical protein CP970_30935 [Streptomyces kanamyceticus]